MTTNGSSGGGCLGWIIAGILLLAIFGIGAKFEETTKVVEKLEVIVHTVEADAQAIRTEYLKLKAVLEAVEEKFKKLEALLPHWKQDGPQIPQAETPTNGGSKDPQTGDSP